MPASKRVTFIDWVSKTDLDQYYSKALAGLVVLITWESVVIPRDSWDRIKSSNTWTWDYL